MIEVNKMLVIIDMQNDFITGPLGTPEAQAIVPKIVDYINKNEFTHVYATRDTHFDDYSYTQEGKKLPVPHCMDGTEGHKLNDEIRKAMNDNNAHRADICKYTFGSIELAQVIRIYYEHELFTTVYLCGVCTDICVISNALLIKAYCPELEIKVLEDLCAGTTPERHENALNVMRSCQIDVIRGSDDE